jgi:hypothetical protein
VCASGRRPGGEPGWRRVRLATGGVDVPVLPLVCLCLVLLWLRSGPVATAVAGALTTGLGVLCTLAVATRLAYLAGPGGLWAWLQLTRLPDRAAGAGTRPH